MISKLTSPTPSKTYEIGSRIGNNLKGDEIILLAGELGAGKTLLTKGIAASLGIDPDEIVSPTFTLMNQFDFQFKSKKKPERTFTAIYSF
ncbi:MAG: tRNA (adenosine(37)-N6)-threonylcarbamoyltransferase complex ATPase subunit type 1 TsaE [Candidatus Aminicenantes bacterium]|nr:tRNA (adenosine(37)-N6)-threonylcarbamoyltransferase complex ATPase subunit type 1 TsaE [Candidatus Aminicenantes bacterium]